MDGFSDEKTTMKKLFSVIIKMQPGWMHFDYKIKSNKKPVGESETSGNKNS